MTSMFMSGSMSLSGYERTAKDKVTDLPFMCLGMREFTIAVEKVRMAAPEAGVMSAP